jgi:hypothetical protein
VVQRSARQTGGSRKRTSGTWQAPAEELIAAFVVSFGPTHKRFGSKSLGLLGVCDDADGPQWSVAMDLQSGRAWLAINLEGKQYDRWPIATFIKRELDQSQLPLIAQNLDSAGIARVAMWRDAWQGAGTRVRILERDIAPTPMALSLVTPESWRSCLQQGLECLDPNRGHRGRRRTHVTLATSRQRVLRDVSPHFNVSLDLVRTSASDNWQQAMSDARHCLEPVFDLVVKQSKP